MNIVSLIGSLVHQPELVTDGPGLISCPMQIAVHRHGPRGELRPGVIYVDVTAYGDQARRCANKLQAGHRIGVVGRLERDDSLDPRGPRRSRWEVHADQVELIDEWQAHAEGGTG